MCTWLQWHDTSRRILCTWGGMLADISLQTNENERSIRFFFILYISEFSFFKESSDLIFNLATYFLNRYRHVLLVMTADEMAALVAVASAGVAVCSLVICIGFMCLRRYVKLVLNFSEQLQNWKHRSCWRKTTMEHACNFRENQQYLQPTDYFQ